MVSFGIDVLYYFNKEFQVILICQCNLNYYLYDTIRVNMKTLYLDW